jgi:nucleotide-binding universal stress UspA family protein
MFKHIAIPTDGSRLAGKGIRAGVKLARSLGARVTGVYVIPAFRRSIYGQYKKERVQEARKALAVVEIEARAAKCDAISMASHERGAVSSLILVTR